jgi:hypothetical protein
MKKVPMHVRVLGRPKVNSWTRHWMRVRVLGQPVKYCGTHKFLCCVNSLPTVSGKTQICDSLNYKTNTSMTVNVRNTNNISIKFV